MPPAPLRSSRWRQLYLKRLVAMTPWLASPRSRASRHPCMAPTDFYKASVSNLVIVAGLGLQRRRPWLAASAAGPSREAGLFGRGSLRSLGRQPAGYAAFGIPRCETAPADDNMTCQLQSHAPRHTRGAYHASITRPHIYHASRPAQTYDTKERHHQTRGATNKP
jgi:hypothetical protein